MCFPTERDTPVSTWIQSHNNHSWFTVFTVPWATSCNTQTGYLIHLNPSSLIGVYLVHLKYAWDDDSCVFLCAEGSKTKCSRSAPTVKFFHKNTHIHIYNVYDCAPKTIACVQPTFPPCGSMSDRCPAYESLWTDRLCSVKRVPFQLFQLRLPESAEVRAARHTCRFIRCVAALLWLLQTSHSWQQQHSVSGLNLFWLQFHQQLPSVCSKAGIPLDPMMWQYLSPLLILSLSTGSNLSLSDLEEVLRSCT